MLVKEVLKGLRLHYSSVNLGEVDVLENITSKQREQIRTELFKWGLELMDNKKEIIIEKIKNVVIEMVHYADELPETNFSDYLKQKLNYDYTYMSNLFSETEVITIEHFIIIHKIERVKELIFYNELNLTEIAWKLHYSSVAHLSTQFKKITGQTPSHFKKLKDKNLLLLEKV